MLVMSPVVTLVIVLPGREFHFRRLTPENPSAKETTQA
jgi:hypothetical protein